MRELAKSMMSYSWAMSVFGMQQAINLMTPSQGNGQCGKATGAFQNVTDATTKTFDNGMRQAFQTGDSVQAAMIDAMFGGFMAGGWDPNRWTQMGANAMRGMGCPTQAQGDANTRPSGGAGAPPPSSDWGPMPR